MNTKETTLYIKFKKKIYYYKKCVCVSISLWVCMYTRESAVPGRPEVGVRTTAGEITGNCELPDK